VVKRRRGNTLEKWEVALVKAMLDRGGYNDQEILAHFTRPTRSINHRAISEIRTGARHKALKAASAEELDAFLVTWPDVDPQTGLSLRGDELLVKAREAMIAAVHTFNGAGLHFRAELFIVTSIIAWTYLLHAFFRREGIDHRYYKNQDDGSRAVDTTKNGAEKYWELGHCLKHDKCPLEKGVRQNLEFLLELRHEIEHRSTNRIDDAVSAKLQACCINFNEVIKATFGQQYGLERRLPIALQFVTFGPDLRMMLKRAGGLPRHIETMMDGFHERLSPEEQGDPQFAYRVAFVPKIVNRASSADLAVEFIKPGSEEAAKINQILVKDGERAKYRPKQIVANMKAKGYRRFTMQNHTDLWRNLKAKEPAKGYGVSMLDGTWYWYETWLNQVEEHCKQHTDRYVPAAAKPAGDKAPADPKVP
jgi:hypothetical protein